MAVEIGRESGGHGRPVVGGRDRGDLRGRVFVEDKDHPGDIDGYFECDVVEFATGNIQRRLNELDPYKVWTWAPASRRPYRNQTKRQLPMWHRYRVELYPHFPGLTSGIRDQFGNDLPFPSAFRLSRREHKPKGIVKIVKGGESA